MAVLAFTIDGMPLIYSGQEVTLDKRLKFFEKDEIDWNGQDKSAFYTQLLKIKKDNPALWNGKFGAHPEFQHCTDGLIAYSRKKGNNEVFVAINFGDKAAKLKNPIAGANDVLRSGVSGDKETIELKPNGYLVLTK